MKRLTSWPSSFAFVAAVLVWPFSVLAHSGHDGDESHGHGNFSGPAGSVSFGGRIWTTPSGTVLEEGSFVMVRGERVQIRRNDGSLVLLRLEALSSGDQDWIAQRSQAIREQQGQDSRPRPVAAETSAVPFSVQTSRWQPVVFGPMEPVSTMTSISDAFAAFEKRNAIKTRSDDRWFYVESNGIPAHQMMVGITSWQQQVPLPQSYTGNNAWQIPMNPVPAKKPRTAKGAFLRGAIAVAVNGIPIFNPLNNRGDDAYLFGELDEFGGHCGRADDYHYHIAPVHLQEIVGKAQPIAYALDGYPIYGYEEPDGSPVKNLDAFNGHKDADGNYHYHATKKYPYLNGGFYGEVIEADGQVDPQPRAEPVRPDLRPLQGAKITDFKETKKGSYLLTYDVRGKQGTVAYTINENQSVTFTLTDPAGKSATETFTPRRQGSGGPGSGEDRRPPRPGEGRQGEGRKGGRPPREDQPPPPDDGKRPARGKGDNTAAKESPLQKKSAGVSALQLKSSSVNSQGFVSIDCTCDGKSESPAIEWTGAPAGTRSFAISLWHTAPDMEKSYWVVYNIPAETTSLKQNVGSIGTIGVNDKKRREYDPMCSRGPGLKTYHITVFALSEELSLLPERATRADLLKAVEGKVLAESTLDFDYERK